VSRIGALGAAVAVVATVGSVVSWQRTEAAAGVGPGPLDGAALFQAKGCASCHDGPESQPLLGGFPPLTDAADWAATRRDGMSAADYVAESIRSPSAFFSPVWHGGVGPTDAMPDLGLTQAEIDAIVEHVLQG
jgi:mono/diheme cytochrome c family protein